MRRRSAGGAEDQSPEAIAAGGGRTALDREMEGQLSDNDTQQALLEAETLKRIKLPVNTKKTEVLARHIRDAIHKDSTNATNVLRTWIAEGDTKRTS
jgi:flagellar biosynthesis/type III secretory pathway M-ring protein FliF/YscJ